jgi:hypothetical protein
VSGSTGVAVAEAVGEAVGLALGLAEAEALLVALVVAEAEALLVALVEAEALETGLAVALSSKPRSSKPRSSAPQASIPLSSAPLSSVWAAATGAKINTANATDKISNTDLRTVSPRFRLHIHDKDAPHEAPRPIQIYGSFLDSVPASPTAATRR